MHLRFKWGWFAFCRIISNNCSALTKSKGGSWAPAPTSYPRACTWLHLRVTARVSTSHSTPHSKSKRYVYSEQAIERLYYCFRSMIDKAADEFTTVPRNSVILCKSVKMKATTNLSTLLYQCRISEAGSGERQGRILNNCLCYKFSTIFLLS